MSTGTQSCDIVLPGYVLSERIGSGGYAEVWRAEAPGGIAKAVKIVYGYYDDELASQELKALERVKGVRHPFLLSLERFEVLNGRLAILTELADMSLDQRLRQCRTEGLPGIPRDELLRYMADAAEALDFLSQRHSLLHLDIKPENLLILGDHIKVADFGLVKELASRTQNSLVSGMTPIYASPEMFDDEPSAHSDQYSLAIVYQEMLVGALPFPGRTPAQLAKQHTQSEPQLMSLPVDDRPVVARALTKKPVDRYPSCRAFVDALLRRAENFPVAAPIELPRPIPAAPPLSAPGPDDTKPPSFCTTLRRTPGQTPGERDATVTQPIPHGAPPAATRKPEADAAPASFVPEQPHDVAVPEINTLLRRQQPTMYVAIGGVGIEVLCRFRTAMVSQASSHVTNDALAAIALDTDRDALREACSNRWMSPLSSEDTLHLPLRLPNSYDNSREILACVSRRWLYNIPRSLETRGYRPLGRVALVDHSQRVREVLDKKLQQLGTVAGSNDAVGDMRDLTIRVVLLAGTGGGTGAGMVLDVANAAKSLAASRNLQVEVHGFLVCTCLANTNATPLAVANTLSLLFELNHATAHGNESTGETTAHRQLFESRTPPFDCIYWVPSGARTKDAPTGDALDAVAKYMALEWTADASQVLRSCRSSQTPREELCDHSLTLKKLGFASLADQKRKLIRGLAADLASAIKRHWLTKDASADWERLVLAEQEAASVLKLAASEDGDPGAPLAVVPVNDATPLALRGQFREHLSLEFASEMVRLIQCQLASRDERGRPIILARDAKLIADTARAVVDTLAGRAERESSGGSQFADSPVLRQLLAEGSRRVLSHAVGKFDPRQPERFLPADLIDEMIQLECQELLEEGITQPSLAAAISELIDLDKATAGMLEEATTDLLQCGYDRRTIVFIPKDGAQDTAVSKLTCSRPLTAVVPAAVDELLIVSEDAGISPRSIALGLERVYPGIAAAARRLFTRIDVEWQSPS